MTVSETRSELATVTMTAIGRPPTKSPAPSGNWVSGRKANSNTPVEPSTAAVISRVPPMAASTGVSPLRKCRSIFSVTTIESSTSKPSERMKPEMLIWFSVKPNRLSNSTPIASDSGIDTMTISEGRNPSGASVISTSASAMPKSRASRPSLRAMSLLWSKPISIAMSGGSVAR